MKKMEESFCYELLLDDVLIPCVFWDRVLQSTNAMSTPKLSDYFQFAYVDLWFQGLINMQVIK